MEPTIFFVENLSAANRFIYTPHTVSSVGWLYDPLKLPYTAANPDIEVGRHAVSIDERRCAFRQNLWMGPAIPNQSIKQIWFAGVHSDVGGGYSEVESGLAKITLQWMIGEAEANGLLTVPARRDDVLGVTNTNMAKPDCTAMLHKSLKGWWWILEVFPRRHLDMKLTPPEERWKIPLASRRYIANNAVIDDSVRERMRLVPLY